LQEILITLADLAVIVSLLVLVEVARRAFAGAQRSLWLVNTAGLLVVAGSEWLKYSVHFKASSFPNRGTVKSRCGFRRPSSRSVFSSVFSAA